jgi:hypothetical protein
MLHGREGTKHKSQCNQSDAGVSHWNTQKGVFYTHQLHNPALASIVSATELSLHACCWLVRSQCSQHATHLVEVAVDALVHPIACTPTVHILTLVPAALSPRHISSTLPPNRAVWRTERYARALRMHAKPRSRTPTHADANTSTLWRRYTVGRDSLVAGGAGPHPKPVGLVVLPVHR